MDQIFYTLLCISLFFFGCCFMSPVPPYNHHSYENGCDICADLVFLFDDSSSIPVSDPLGFHKMKQFMVAVVQSFTQFGPPSGVQVSLVLVAHTVRNYFYLNTYTNISAIVQAINTFPELSGSATAIGEGLKFIRERSFLPINGGGRLCANKFVILLTDGKHNLGIMPKPQADALKNDDVTIITIGVGRNVLLPELESIASKPEFVFNVTDFTQLTTISEAIVDDACQVANEKQPPKKPCDKKSGLYMPYGYVLVPIFSPVQFPMQLSYLGTGNVNADNDYSHEGRHDEMIGSYRNAKEYNSFPYSRNSGFFPNKILQNVANTPRKFKKNKN